MKVRRGELATKLVTVAGVIFAAAPVWACPSCNQGLEGDPAALAFYWGTLLLMAMPYTLALTVGGGVFFVYWRAARNAPAQLETESVLWPEQGPEKEGGR